MGMIDDITIEELAWDAQGEWASVTEEFAPQWTHGYKRILAEIEGMREIKAYVAEIAQPAAPAQPATGGGADAVALSHTAETLAGKLVSLEMRVAVALGLPDDEFLNGDHDHMLTCIENAQYNRDTRIKALTDILEDAQQQLADANARAAAAEAALEPFAEAWLRVPLGLKSVLRIWNGREGDESGYDSLGISTDNLQGAHTAFFNLEPTPKKEG